MEDTSDKSSLPGHRYTPLLRVPADRVVDRSSMGDGKEHECRMVIDRLSLFDGNKTGGR